MAVRFVIGRAGSGKTAHFLRQTIDACRRDPLGEPIIWLVPRQATFLIERELCCGELGGFFRVQVVSLELLCRQVLAEVGPNTPEVSPLGRQMILFRLLRQHQDQLRFFQSVAGKPGLAAELSGTLDELNRCEVNATLIRKNLPDITEASLRDKLSDLALIQTAYAAYLGNQRIDPDGRTRAAMEAFGRSALLRQATVFVDGFLKFSMTERRIITRLAQVCRGMEISLTMDPAAAGIGNIHHVPDDLCLTHRAETEFRKFSFALSEMAVKVEKPVLLTETKRFKAAALKRIEQWNASGPETGGLEMIEAADKRGEVEAIALRIRDLIAAGWRWRDIAVLARQVSEYQDLIDAIFHEHNIPFFVDGRRSAGHHPLIQLVRAILDAAADPWGEEPMLTIIKSGLCGLSIDESAELENQLLSQDIRGKDWPTSKIPLAQRVAIPLIHFITDNNIDRPMRQWATDLQAILEAFGTRQALAKWIEIAPVEQAEEHRQVWEEFSACLDQLVELLGDHPAAFEDFASLLHAALEKLDLAIAPPTVDQVLVGQADRTRTPNVRVGVVLGLNNGQFPMRATEAGVFSDWDRRKLTGLVELESDARRAALDEEFIGYFAFTRASEKLIVTRAVADESGKAIGPGSLWQKLRQLLPQVQVQSAAPRNHSSATDIATPRQFITRLMHWARQPADDLVLAELYEWLAHRPESDPVKIASRRALPALVYNNEARLSPELAKRLFPLPLHVDAYQLESFAACAFQHFVRFGLKLSARAEGGLEEKDTRRLCQEVLRQLGRNTDDATVHELVRIAAGALRGENIFQFARNHHLLNRIETMVRQSFRARQAAEGRGEFRAAEWGVPFDSVPVGDKLLLRGKCDRVDRAKSGDVLHDYQLNASALPLAEVYYGLTLELIANVLGWQSKRGALPAATLASPMSRKLRNETPGDAPAPEDELFNLLAKSRGLIDERFALSLDRKLSDGGQSEVIAAYRSKDGSWGHREKSDIVSPAEMRALLAHVRKQLIEFADRIAGGEISVKPYRMGLTTPCARCRFNDVCRFEPEQGYRRLAPMKRTQVLERVVEEQAK